MCVGVEVLLLVVISIEHALFLLVVTDALLVLTLHFILLVVFLVKNSYEQLLLFLCVLLNVRWSMAVASTTGSIYL
jgi:hypothetical protein